MSVRVKQVSSKEARFKGAPIEEAIIDVLDPGTLRPVIATTRVQRDPAQVSQSVALQVGAGNWMIRIQGRDAQGQAAGTRFESPVQVVPNEISRLQAELDPLTGILGLTVSPGPALALAEGTLQQMQCTATNTDLRTEDVTGQVIWTAGDASVANISAGGLLSANRSGTTQVTARSGSFSNSVTVTVSRKELTQLQITPANVSLSPGLTQQLECRAIYSDRTNQDVTNQVSWSTSDAGVARISSTGLVTGVKPGQVSVTALLGDRSVSSQVQVVNELTRLEVTPSSSELPVGKSQALTARGFFADGTSQDLTDSVTWTSANAAVANVSAAGVVTATGVGSTQVTAASGSVRGTSAVTVTAAVLTSLQVTPGNLSVPKGTTQQLRALGRFSDGSSRDVTQSATWTSTNTSLAAVSNANGTRGVVSGLQLGKTVVEATLDAVGNSSLVEVTPAVLSRLELRPVEPTALAPTTVQFDALGTFSDSTVVNLTQDVTWTSSVPGVASISNVPGAKGQAQALSAGITAITAASGNVSNSTIMRVDSPGGAPPVPTPTPSPTPSMRLTSATAADANTTGNSDSRHRFSDTAVSGDGRYSAFITQGNNLVVPGQPGVMRRDHQDNETLKVNIVSGSGASDDTTASPNFRLSITPDGRYIAFTSAGTNLDSITPDTNGVNDVFRHDTLTGTTIRVSLVDGGVLQGGVGLASENPCISPDGNFVAFESVAALKGSDTNGLRDIYVRNITANTTSLASVSSGGALANGASKQPTMRNHGQAVAFSSDATNLIVPADGNSASDVYLRDLTGSTTILISKTPGGVPGAGSSTGPYMTPDTRYISFTSNAGDLGPTSNGFNQIYLYDRNTSTMTIESVATGGTLGNANCGLATLSDNARYIAIQSDATNLVTPDVGGFTDCFVRDRTANVTIRVSQSTAGVQGNGHSFDPNLSGDGRWIDFHGFPTNFGFTDTNGVDDDFMVRNLLAP